LTYPDLLGETDIFLRPLFRKEVGKIYSLNRSLELQRPLRRKQEEEGAEILDFDDALWQEEMEQKRREKLRRYEGSLSYLVDAALAGGEVSLWEIGRRVMENAEELYRLIPTVEIFKEIMVELIKNREIDIQALQKERSENIGVVVSDFQLSEMILKMAETEAEKHIKQIEVRRIEDGKTVVFEHVRNEEGIEKSIRCSNVSIRIITE
jgi:hypothetical protein